MSLQMKNDNNEDAKSSNGVCIPFSVGQVAE